MVRPEHLQMLQAHAERVYPEECCGLLLGVYEPEHDRAHVHAVRPADNDWNTDVNPFAEGDRAAASKRNRFWIDPQLLLTAQRDSRDRGWSIVGIYHSHPDHPAVPSERDRQLAWSSYSYPILSVTTTGVVDIRSWRLNEQHQFAPESLLTADSQPC